MLKKPILSIFIISLSNAPEEHLQAISHANHAHLTLFDAKGDIVGCLWLVGLANEHKAINLKRVVIYDKGKGYGRKAIQWTKHYCFEELGYHRLALDTIEENLRARQLYLSEGFKEEGVLREVIMMQGQYQSLVLMAILKHEFEYFHT